MNNKLIAFQTRKRKPKGSKNDTTNNNHSESKRIKLEQPSGNKQLFIRLYLYFHNFVFYLHSSCSYIPDF